VFGVFVALWAKLFDWECPLSILLFLEDFVILVVIGDIIKVSTNSAN